MAEIGYLTFTLFLLMDSFGNIPLFLSFLKGTPPKRQKWVIFREMVIALIIIFTFNFLGEGLLFFLQINTSTVQIAGGIILFILSLRMIFPAPKESGLENSLEEPFIVPLAVPLIAGPAVLAAVILYSHQTSIKIIALSIFLSWGFSLIVLLLSPLIQKFLGNKGVIALERLMGLVLILIAVQMFLSGFSACLHASP